MEEKIFLNLRPVCPPPVKLGCIPTFAAYLVFHFSKGKLKRVKILLSITK